MNQIIIYGAGVMGKQYYDSLKAVHMENVIHAYCDKNYEQIKNINGIPVYSYDDLKNQGIPFVISTLMQKEICTQLENDAQVYYNNIGEWIKNYREDDSDRIKMWVACQNRGGV